MELEKIQKFLINKNKFERKKQNFEIIEDIKNRCEKLCKQIKKENKPEIESEVAHFILDLIQLCNIYNLNLSDFLKKTYKFGE